MATNAIQTDRSTQIGIHQAWRTDTTSAGGGNHRSGRSYSQNNSPPSHALGIQTIFLFSLGFDYLLDQALDLGIFDPFGLIRKILGHDQFHHIAWGLSPHDRVVMSPPQRGKMR